MLPVKENESTRFTGRSSGPKLAAVGAQENEIPIRSHDKGSCPRFVCLPANFTINLEHQIALAYSKEHCGFNIANMLSLVQLFARRQRRDQTPAPAHLVADIGGI
jgi:hypothetical protein